MSFHVPNKFRVLTGRMGSDASIGNCGAFVLKVAHSQRLNAVASDEFGWEHVSVSREDRAPTWGEMCQVKELFWDDEDVVIQFHPAKSQYVNNHPNCLHLWRPTEAAIQTPPSLLVGIK